ncbi:MAG: amidohydrolase [Bacteroidetes bacterium]|nr:amidohydrolase [Bacteroidota bacterium]
MIPITDAHAHFWSPERFDYPWIAEDSPFARDFLLDAYCHTTVGIAIERMVFVECDCHPRHSVAEAAWVLELAASDRRIQGIVAHAELTEPASLDVVLDALAANPLVRGIRHNIQGQPPGFCLQESFVTGVRKAGLRGFHFELCITHEQLPDALALVRLCPDVSFMLDHCGKPGIRSGQMDPWTTHLRLLAQMPQVSCKISGLLTEADWNSWIPAQILPYIEYAAEAFGPARIIYGSDWPVNTVAGGYASWQQVVEEACSSWSHADQLAFFHENAGRFYRL